MLLKPETPLISEYPNHRISQSQLSKHLNACFSNPAERWSQVQIRSFVAYGRIAMSLGAGNRIYTACCYVADTKSIEIISLATDPNNRCRGFAQQLLEHCLRNWRESGIENVVLVVRHSNIRARALYERCGFSEISRVANAYSGDRPEDGIRLISALD